MGAGVNDYFFFDGVDSRDFGILVYRLDVFGAPERVYQTIQIPGRNGDILRDEGRFTNMTHTYSVISVDKSQPKMTDFRDFLLSKSGYFRLEDTFEPDEFYEARLLGGVSFEATDDAKLARAEITFERKPQRFMKSGEDGVMFDENGKMFNHTRQNARPMIRVYGVGEFLINDQSVIITSNNSYIDIDCERQDAFRGNANMNQYVQFTKVDFPVLVPGENQITLRPGVARLEITPRWWRL